MPTFDLPRRLVAEALGTALLVATVVGSGIMAESLTRDVALALLGNTLATGAMLVVLITILGPISGAHFNPAVTLIFALKRELMPNYLLHWRAMLDFRAMGCDTYDWWGIPEEPAPDHPWFGLYRFKTGFGGQTVRYIGLYEHVLRPGRLRLEQRLQQWKARIRAPVPILR